ncbi:hypothetical protein ATCC90586_002211 [Pythium insidiosum]|nr:hypothetical protein ATCC90586_002211 [Pythium insidiosum]
MAATIVPVSHSQRWRSRSRNPSTDLLQDLHITVPVDAGADDDDDRDDDFDDVQVSPWLVVPQGFVSPAQPRSTSSSPASPSTPTPGSWQKAMEMRRAIGSQ